MLTGWPRTADAMLVGSLPERRDIEADIAGLAVVEAATGFVDATRREGLWSPTTFN